MKPPVRTKAIPIVLIGCVAFMGVVFGQEGAERPSNATTLRLSLEEALRKAREASPPLRRLDALQRGAEAQLRGAKAQRLPQVDLSAQASRFSHVPEFVALFPPPQGPTVIFPDLPDRYSGRIGLTVPLYTGGRIAGEILSAEKESAAVADERASGEKDLDLEVTAAYWELLMARESARVLGEAVASYEAHLHDALAREKNGIAARNEVLAVQVERDAAELARLRAENDAEVAHADLARILALSSGTRIEPTAILEPAAAAMEDLESLVDEALRNRPDREALKARVASSEARVRAFRAERYPQARFSAGYEVLDPNLRYFPPAEGWHDDWDASLSLSLRVFDGGRASASVAQAEARTEAAHQELEGLDQRIRFDTTRRHLEFKTALAEVDLAEKSLDSAKENRRVASERFRAGVIPSSELLDAETALLRAGLQRTASLTRERLALARLQRAVGR
jgi:outer membrane protein TolC